MDIHPHKLSFNRRFAMVGFCLLTLAGATGCGGGGGIERAPVSGKVTFDGTPVEKGLIVMTPTGETKGPSSGAEIKNGEYSIPRETGLVPGTYKVEITASKSVGRIEVQGVAGATGGLSGSQTAENLVMYIPEKYNTQSTLTYTVKSGSNTENFTLVSK